MAAKKKPSPRKPTTKRKPRSKTGSPRPSAPKLRIANLREDSSASPLLTKFCSYMVAPYAFRFDLKGTWKGPLVERQRSLAICDGLVRRILPIALKSENHDAAGIALQGLPELTSENIGIVASVVANVFTNLENFNGPDTPGVSSVYLTYEALAAAAELSWVSASVTEYERIGYDAAVAIIKTTETKASKLDIAKAINEIIDAILAVKIPENLKENPWDARRSRLAGSRGTVSSRGTVTSRGQTAPPTAAQTAGTATGATPADVATAEAVMQQHAASSEETEKSLEDYRTNLASWDDSSSLPLFGDDPSEPGERSGNPRYGRAYNPRGGGSSGPPTRRGR
jgi:hypothetical protein